MAAAGALLLAACGGDTATETTVAAAAETTTTQQATPETSAAETTTTTAAETTTSSEAAGSTIDPEIEVLFARVAAAQPTSARYEGTMAMSGSDPDLGAFDFSIPFGGSYDQSTGNTSFSMDMSAMAELAGAETDDELGSAFAAGFLGEMEVRQIGETAYIKFPLFAMMFGAETEWVSMSAEDGEAFQSDFQTMPTPDEMFGAYDGAAGTLEVLETGDVNGAQATHYRLTLDGAAYLAGLSAEERAEVEAEGTIPNGSFPVDLWVTDEGHMVRMMVEIDGTMVDSSAMAPGESFDSMTMTFDVFDIDSGVTIEAPPAADVTPVDDLASGMFGGLEEPES